MAFEKPKKQPTFADLKAILSQTQLDNTTYQLLQTLIERLVQYQSVITEELATKGSGSGNGKPGEAGPAGPQGPTGPQGPPGSSNAVPHAPTHRPGGNDPLVNNAWTDIANTFNQRQTIGGGVSGNYAQAPLEIAMTGNPRVSFHWPGIVASQLGMDSNGWIRTFDNPGTGYAPFAAAGIVANGAFQSTVGQYLYPDSNWSMLTTGATVQCFADQYYWTNKANTFHHMTMDSASNVVLRGRITADSLYMYNASYISTLSAGVITVSTLNTPVIQNPSGAGVTRISNVVFNADNGADPGLPYIRAAGSAAHMCINARPIYLNLDIPGNSILVYGPMTCFYPVNFQTNFYPTVDGAYQMGTQSLRFSNAYFALPAAASGPAIVTGATGALYYISSSRKTKQNFRPAELAQSRAVLELTPQYYQNLDATPEDPYVLGVVTDEVPEILNDLVFRAERPAVGRIGTETMESFHYDRVALHLLVVMKDMNRRIEELETARGI